MRRLVAPGFVYFRDGKSGYCLGLEDEDTSCSIIRVRQQLNIVAFIAIAKLEYIPLNSNPAATMTFQVDNGITGSKAD